MIWGEPFTGDLKTLQISDYAGNRSQSGLPAKDRNDTLTQFLLKLEICRAPRRHPLVIRSEKTRSQHATSRSGFVVDPATFGSETQRFFCEREPRLMPTTVMPPSET